MTPNSDWVGHQHRWIDMTYLGQTARHSFCLSCGATKVEPLARACPRCGYDERLCRCPTATETPR